MAENLAKWRFKRGPIFKTRPSDGCRRDAVTLAVERQYDFHGFRCHLGNVGLGLGEVATQNNLPIPGVVCHDGSYTFRIASRGAFSYRGALGFPHLNFVALHPHLIGRDSILGWLFDNLAGIDVEYAGVPGAG